MARPGDWSALKLSGDPTPGDPDILLSVADYMDAMATNAQTADTGLGQVLKTSGEGAFVGKTADWLREQVTNEMQGFIAGVKQAFSATGPAIRTYVTALREAQSKADAALNQAAGADENRLATLKADAEAAGSDLKTAAETAKTAIHDATAYIKSPTTPKSACDIFWEIFGWLTLIISIVAIFVGGPLGLIAFGMGVALAIKAVVDFAEGKTNVLGLVLGLLGVLGPSTRPLIGLTDLTKLVKASTAAITKVAKSGATTLAKGLTDFWHMAQTFSFTEVLRGIGDISVVMANAVKVGLLNIPKTVSSLDLLAVRGFATLKGFVLQQLPRAMIIHFPAALSAGLGAMKGFAVDLGHLLKAGALGTGRFIASEFGGWKALRLFTPLAAHEIGQFGVLGAFKIGVLGRGLGIERFTALGTVGTGFRLAEGLTAVNIVKPGSVPHAGGGGSVNFSSSGLLLPDMTEHPMAGVHATETGFSAHGIEVAGLNSPATHDLAGFSQLANGTGFDLPAMNTLHLETHALPAALDLSGAQLNALGQGNLGRLAALTGSTDNLNMPAMGSLGAATMPQIQLSDLSAGLNKFAHGIDGLTAFGRPEMRNLNTGDVTAVRVSDTGVAFNLGAPETAFTSRAIDLTTTGQPGGTNAITTPSRAIDSTTTGQPGGTNAITTPSRAIDSTTTGQPGGTNAITTPAGPAPHPPPVNQAMDLLAEPAPGGGRPALGKDAAAIRPDEAGLVTQAQAGHLRALDQLRRAQDALAEASGDPLAAARAEKDVRIAESLVQRTGDGVRIEPDMAGELGPAGHLPGGTELELRAVPGPGRVIEVDTDRFSALREPFRFETTAGGEHPFAVSRPPAGGERIGVRYRLDVTEHDMHFTLRLHLDADSGVSPAELAATKAATHEGIRRYVNEPGYVLSGYDRQMRMTVEFVDDPALAHNSIPLSHDLMQTNQGAWRVGQSPGTYAHEAVHHLGVRDGLRRPDALLRPVRPADPVPHDLMGTHGHDEMFVLSPAALDDITAVLSPHFSGSLGSTAAAMVAHGPDNLWASGADVAPAVTGKGKEVAPAGEEIPMVPITRAAAQDVVEAPPAETPAGELPGLYRERPELLYEVDSIDDIERLIADIEAGATTAVQQRINATWKGNVPVLAGRPAKTAKIAAALRDDQQSFFTKGGRSFDIEDGLGDWHRVTVNPEWEAKDTTFLSQVDDKAKFDTRTDFSSGTKAARSGGNNGSLGVIVNLPNRLGYGGGGGFEGALSRPTDAVEDAGKLTDSHNTRSGSGSHLVGAPTRFQVTAEEPRGPIGGAGSTRGTAPPIESPVTFRAVDDIAKAEASSEITPIRLDERVMSEIVEHFTPVRILRAGLDLADGQRPTRSWHDVSEEMLVRLHPTKTVNPGSVGADAARDLLSEPSFISHLIPALDGPVHPPVISSPHSAHALSVELNAVMSEFSALMRIDKSSFRWMPGLSFSHKAQQSSRVGGALTAVPVRWSFGPAYLQVRLSGGFFRSMNASHSGSSVSRIGTEFKDIKNVGVETHVRLRFTPVLQEVPGSRMPFTSGAVPTMTIDLVVFGRLPLTKALELAGEAGSLALTRQPWFVPPYAKTGGRSVTYGLTQFTKYQADVTEVIRRYEGGFLPRFADQTKVLRMGSSRAALERAANQTALDRVISPAGLRQGEEALLKLGLIAELTRTRKIGTRHLIVHVTGRYVNDFDHLGREPGQAVRVLRSDGSQQKIAAGGQWRGNVTFEGAAILRYRTDLASVAATPGLALEYRGRFTRQSGAQLIGNQSRLNGGTPDSHVFGNHLEITVDIYAYTRRITYDPRAHLRFGRTIEQRLPRDVTGTPPAPHATPTTREMVPHTGGTEFARYRMVETKLVRKLYDTSTVMPRRVVQEPVFTPRPDPMSVNRRTRLDLDSLRDWIDAVPDGEQLRYPVRDWLSVEAMPGNKFVLDLARDALTAAQKYADDLFSQTKIGGLYGVESLDEGMPLWAGLISRLNDTDQVSALRSMMNDQWTVDKLMTDEAGAQVDMAVVASLTNPELLPAHGLITVEKAAIGGVEADASKSLEQQVVARANVGGNIRKPGTAASTSGGGGLLQVAYEKILYAKTERQGESLAGFIERNANNRKGKTRSYIVKFDLRLSVAVELTTNPAKFGIIPSALRTGEWLHHFKSIQRDGTITNALYLRLSADVVDKLGLLPKLPADPGAIAQPWLPKLATELRLPPGHGPGLGLYMFHEVPTLTAAMTQALRRAAAHYQEDKSWVDNLLDKIANKVENRSVTKISDSVGGMGLADPMLNRRRLLYLFTPDGVEQHWPAMVDGGVSVLHTKPAKLTQHSRDVRLIAEPTTRPKFRGFVASHDDLDIKTTLAGDVSTTVQRTHGHAETAGLTATGVSNHHGENFAMGYGDNVGRSSQKSNTQSSGTTTVQTDLSSGRGVKARMEFGVKFSLVIFDQGKPIDEPLLVVHDVVQQDRWADDLRLPRERTADDKLPDVKAPTAYPIREPEEFGPGWTTSNGLPIPPRFAAEDLTQLARLQKTVEGMLVDAAKRLAKPGYAGAHTIRQGLTPHILLPGSGKMLQETGLDLPPAVSAQIFGQRARINIRQIPEAVSLNGVSSGVFREHAPQSTAGYSAGSNKLVQWLRQIRLPVMGRGFTDTPEQGLEHGGSGAVAGDSHVAAETGSGATGSLGNTKPESRSAALDYLTRIEVTIHLDHVLSRFVKPIKLISPDSAGLHVVTLRMGLHDGRAALGLGGDVGTLADDAALRLQSFTDIAAHEATLAKAADEFIAAAEKLDTARFEAYAAAENSAARAEHEQTIPGLHQEWEAAGEKWWSLEQQHYQMLDDFRHDHLGVTASATDARRGELSGHIRQQTLDAAEPSLKNAATLPIKRTRVVPPPPKPTSLPVTVPADGRCQLYAMIASNPGRVGDKLAEAGLGSPHLHAWLAKAADVRTQLRDLAATPMRDDRGLVPAHVELADAAENLRLLVERNLHEHGSNAVPSLAVQTFRNFHFTTQRAEVNAMNRAQLLDQLREYGLTEIRNGELISTDQLRGAYRNLRTEELVGGGQGPDAARVTASAEATGGTLSKQELLDYVRAHGQRFSLNNLGDDLLRDVALERYLSTERPLDDLEFAQIVAAVGTWEREWSADAGETFLPLLARVLEARVQVHAPGRSPFTLGRDGAPLIQVHRTGDHYDGGRAIESQARAKTKAAKTPVRTMSIKAVPAEPPRTVPGGIVHDVPAEGRGQLYSVLGGDPGRVGERLTAAGVDTTRIRDWLGNPQLVRDDLARWRTNGIRNAAGLVPLQSELGRAAEQLRQLVGDHLAALGRERVPAQVTGPYRRHMLTRQVQVEIDGMDHGALIARLHDYGIDRVQHGHLLPLDDLVNSYVAVRTERLVAGGTSATAAPVLARREVRMNAKGGLAHSAPTPQQMLDRIHEHGRHFDLRPLTADRLRAMAAFHYLDEGRALSAEEFAGLTEAVRTWETTSGAPLGETFLPLLASTLDVQFRVHQPGKAVARVGRDGAETIDLFRQGDHYQAMERTTAPPPAPPARIKTFSRSIAHKMTRMFPSQTTAAGDFQQQLRTWYQKQKFANPVPAPASPAGSDVVLTAGPRRLAAEPSTLPNPNRNVLRDRYGMPESSARKLQAFVDEHGLAVYVRPTNPAGIRWADGLAGPKPVKIKAKTINQLDVRLGASEHTIGLVGLMRPERAPDHGLKDTLILRMPEDATAAERPALESRLRQRAAEFNRLAPEAAELIQKGELGLHHGVIGTRDAHGSYAPITGDHDLFDIRLADGAERGLVESELDGPSYQAVVDLMVARDMGVMHGAHMRWNRADPTSAATFADPADAAMFNHIVHGHQKDGGGEPLIRFAAGRPVSLVWAPREIRSGVTSPLDLNHEYGPPAYPEGIQPHELDPSHDVRVNPALMLLSDFEEFVWAGRPDAQWHYVVAEDGQVWIGSRQMSTVVSGRQIDDLFVKMHAKDPTLTMHQLRVALGEQSHATIGPRFTEDGHARPGPARINGGLSRDPETGVWTVTDEYSGHLPAEIRAGLTPGDVERWLGNVVRRLRARLGAEVRAVTVRPAEGDDTVDRALALLADPS
ncbi:hypothetical protein [Actinoplanes sp. NPDC049265]|uniref:hypothetical protein n=1 Tax=Actinoplanes sp. NPDC049265 TaxID=3363902 RepID=UPI00371BA9BB